MMNIQYSVDQKLFKLDTTDTTYAMQVLANGMLAHLYWGPRLDHNEDLPTQHEVMRAISFDHFRRDEALQEYMPAGGYYFDEHTLKATFADGVRDVRLRYQSHGVRSNPNSMVLSITLADQHYPLQVELIFEIYDDCDIIDKYCVLTNTGEATIQLEKAFSAMWRLPYQKAYRLTHLAGRWAGEYQLERLPITQSKINLETRSGTSGYDACPLFMIDDGCATEQRGDVYFGSVQWSGNWKMVVEKTRYGIVQVSGGINDYDFAWPLKGGESFETPRFTGGFCRSGFGSTSRMIHSYQRRHLMTPQNADRIMPIVYNSWSSFKFAIDATRMIKLAKLAADAGCEMFIIDDGWFGSNRLNDNQGVGDWTPDPRKFPNGLTPLVQAVNDLKMIFGIWIEPEMVNPDSDLYRRHPDWILRYENREGTLCRNTYHLNLARQDVCAYLYERLDWLLGTHNIGYLKFDHNRYIAEAGWPEAPADEQKTMWVVYIRNFYALLDRLCAKYPDVIMENCAMGGARVDLAMTRYTVRINRSDNQDTLDVLKLHEGFTHLMLPRTAGGGCHISQPAVYHINDRTVPMRYQAHVGMMGSLAIGDNLFDYTNEQMEELKSYTALYKQIRETVHLGNFYRLVSPCDNPYAVNLYVRPDKSQAVLFVLGQSMQFQHVLPRIKVPDLIPTTIYTVENHRPMSGKALAELGIPVDLKGDFDSKVIRIRANA